MNDHTQNGMAEATRLTQQGRLEEATAAIQRALGGTHFPPSSTGGSGAAGPIDVDSWIVREDPRAQGGERRTAHREPKAATWTTPGPTLLTHGLRLLQAIRTERVRWAGRPTDRHASRLHPEP
jgi:hypothetical protein